MIYRSNTVLPAVEKILDIAVQRRLEFGNDAFDKTDSYNVQIPEGLTN